MATYYRDSSRYLMDGPQSLGASAVPVQRCKKQGGVRIMLLGLMLATVFGAMMFLANIPLVYAVSPFCDLCGQQYDPVKCCEIGGEATDTNPSGDQDTTEQQQQFRTFCQQYRATKAQKATKLTSSANQDAVSHTAPAQPAPQPSAPAPVQSAPAPADSSSHAALPQSNSQSIQGNQQSQHNDAASTPPPASHNGAGTTVSRNTSTGNQGNQSNRANGESNTAHSGTSQEPSQSDQHEQETHDTGTNDTNGTSTNDNHSSESQDAASSSDTSDTQQANTSDQATAHNDTASAQDHQATPNGGVSVIAQIIAGIVIILVLGGGAGWWWFGRRKHASVAVSASGSQVDNNNSATGTNVTVSDDEHLEQTQILQIDEHHKTDHTIDETQLL